MTSSAAQSGMPADPPAEIIPAGRLDSRIFLVRAQKVILDRDLAELYGVETGALNRTVGRNRIRFPADFMFQLTAGEFDALKCQSGISKPGRGGRRFLPYAFTEQGVAMLSGLLNSARAIAVNIEIMRAFVRLRQMIASHADLARQLERLERKYDGQFRVVFEAIRELMLPPPGKNGEMGFHTKIGVLRKQRPKKS